MQSEKSEKKKTFNDLIDVMAALRGENGCPWDKKQSLNTIKDYFLEEVYEAYEALQRNDIEAIKEELGDVLFEVTFLARIAEEKGWFDINDSTDAVVTKLIRRHPHVFGDEKVTEASEVPGRWAKLKAQEKSKKKDAQSILEGVPLSLPPLLQALRISERAVAVGFEWKNVSDVFDKLDEEILELKEAIKKQESKERLEDELGDILFTLVNVARKLEITTHDSLMRSMNKFRKRFGFLESTLKAEGTELSDAKIEKMEELWQMAKRLESE